MLVAVICSDAQSIAVAVHFEIECRICECDPLVKHVTVYDGNGKLDRDCDNIAVPVKCVHGQRRIRLSDKYKLPVARALNISPAVPKYQRLRVCVCTRLYWQQSSLCVRLCVNHAHFITVRQWPRKHVGIQLCELVCEFACDRVSCAYVECFRKREYRLNFRCSWERVPFTLGYGVSCCHANPRATITDGLINGEGRCLDKRTSVLYHFYKRLVDRKHLRVSESRDFGNTIDDPGLNSYGDACCKCDALDDGNANGGALRNGNAARKPNPCTVNKWDSLLLRILVSGFVSILINVTQRLAIASNHRLRNNVTEQLGIGRHDDFVRSESKRERQWLQQRSLQ